MESPVTVKRYYIPNLNIYMSQEEVDVCESEILDRINQKLEPLNGREVTVRKEDNEALFKEIQNELSILLRDFPSSSHGNYYLGYTCKISCNLLLSINGMNKIFREDGTLFPPIIGYQCTLPDRSFKKWTLTSGGDQLKITNLRNVVMITNQVNAPNSELNHPNSESKDFFSIGKMIKIGNDFMKTASITADIILNSNILHSSLQLNIRNIEDKPFFEIPILYLEGKVRPDGTMICKGNEIDLEAEHIITGNNCTFINSSNNLTVNSIIN